MGFFTRFNPLNALRDIRLYFHRRGPLELAFISAALIGTSVIIGLFILDTPPVPRREQEIVYVQQWRADRTDAEIIAQQQKDKPAEDAQRAAFEQAQLKHQAELKKLDDKLKSWGF
jgi:hypothetical protein